MAKPDPAAGPAARRGPEAADEAIKDASENPSCKTSGDRLAG